MREPRFLEYIFYAALICAAATTALAAGVVAVAFIWETFGWFFGAIAASALLGAIAGFAVWAADR